MRNYLNFNVWQQRVSGRKISFVNEVWFWNKRNSRVNSAFSRSILPSWKARLPPSLNKLARGESSNLWVLDRFRLQQSSPLLDRLRTFLMLDASNRTLGGRQRLSSPAPVSIIPVRLMGERGP